MRQIAAKPACSASFLISSQASSEITRNTVCNSDVRPHTRFLDAKEDAKEVAMNKDRVAGATKEAVGGIKEKTGKALGDTEMEVEGKAKKVEGKVQNAAGKVEDEVRDAARRAEDAARRADKGRW
jgi:uncharacterized protein YjbJ (UPF0337 family)